MCGTAGKLFFDSGRAVDVELLRRMIDPIRHRAPDDDGVISEANVGLTHPADIDLSSGRQLPADLKLRGTNGKFPLNKCFEGCVQRETIELKKAGFPIPYESWFGNELRPFSRELLLGDVRANRRALNRAGLLLRF